MARQSQETKEALAAQKAEFNDEANAKRIEEAIKLIKDNDAKYYVIFVRQDRFDLVEKIVFGACGLVLLGVFSWGLKLVLK